MFNSLIIATAKEFTQGNADKHGKSPVILNVLAGKCPNRTVLSGTIAEREGFTVGKSYLVQVREIEADAKYGRQFIFSKAGDVSTMDILTANAQLGDAKIFNVDGSDSATNNINVEVPEDKEIIVEE